MMSSLKSMSWGVALAAIALMIVACGKTEESEPYRECISDADCGPGYICEFQACKRVIDPDNDVESPADGDEDFDPEEAVEDDTTDSEDDADDQPPADGDEETDPDESDNIDGDGDAGEFDEDLPTCDGQELDERCSFLSESYCRSGVVKHSVMVCHIDQLYYCIQRYDPCYPPCGYYTEERYQKACQEGCVPSEDPELDDYCAEDGPPDGDEEEDAIEDSDGADTAEAEEELDGETANHNDGYPCSTAADCLPGHACQLDYDDAGRHCAADRYTCVYHVDMEPTELADFYHSGNIVCHDNGYRRCTSAGSWSSVVECPRDECVSGYLFWPGQTCVDNSGCEPWPREDPGPCPDHFACFDAYNCRGSCVISTECAPGYICIDSACVPNNR